MKMVVCRLCGVPHRSSDPHVFDMKAAPTIEAEPRSGAFQRKASKPTLSQPKAEADYVTRAEFEALKAELLALQSDVTALRSNGTPSLVGAPKVGVSNAERQRRFRERKRAATS